MHAKIESSALENLKKSNGAELSGNNPPLLLDSFKHSKVLSEQSLCSSPNISAIVKIQSSHDTVASKVSNQDEKNSFPENLSSLPLNNELLNQSTLFFDENEQLVNKEATSTHSPKEASNPYQALMENPFSTSSHVCQLAISQLMESGELLKLRLARTRYAIYFPTDEDFWIQWIQEEERLYHYGVPSGGVFEKLELPKGSLNLSSKNEHCGTYSNLFPPPSEDALSAEQIKNLFDVALNYCPSSPSLWLNYVAFVSNNGYAVGGSKSSIQAPTSEVRRLFERALGSIGLHALDGPEIWSAYRIYEMKLLEAASDSRVVSAQVQKTRKLFYRQLKLPLAGLPDLLDEYRVWEAELPDTLQVGIEEGEKCYQIGHAEWEKRKNFEMRAQNEIDDLSNISGINSVWNDYLEFEMATKDPARICIVYLRALEDIGGIRQDLWLAYADYLTDILKDPNRAIPTFARAVTHFPHSCKIWINYILCQSATGSTVDTILELFETALKGCADSIADIVEIFLTCADCVRRYVETADLNEFELPVSFTSSNSEKSVQGWDLVRSFFQQAETRLMEYNSADEYLYAIYHHWARFETYNSKSIPHVTEVCEKMVAKFGERKDVWTQYVGYMRYLLPSSENLYSNLSHLFKRALQQVKDFPDLLKDEWMQFESELGTVQSIKQARRFLEIPRAASRRTNSGSSSNQFGSDLMSGDSGKEFLTNAPIIEVDDSTNKEIVCLSSIRNRRNKRRRKGVDGDIETSSDASSESSISSLNMYRKTRNSTLFPGSSDGVITPSSSSESSNPLIHLTPNISSFLTPNSVMLGSPQNNQANLPTSVLSNARPGKSTYTSSSFIRSPKSSPNSVPSSPSYSPSPSVHSPRHSRSPSPLSRVALENLSFNSLPSSNNFSLNNTILSDVERLTCATWDGHESIDPASAPNVPPLDNLRSPSDGSSSKSQSDVNLNSPAALNIYGSRADMPPPLFTPNMHKKYEVPIDLSDDDNQTNRSGISELEHTSMDVDRFYPEGYADMCIEGRIDSFEDIVQDGYSGGTNVGHFVEDSNEIGIQYPNRSGKILMKNLSLQPHFGHHYRQTSEEEGNKAALSVLDNYANESRTLWVSNLDETVSERDLREIFARFGGFIEVRLVKNRKNISKGFAYVDFDTVEAAKAASDEVNGTEINERKIKALISQPTQPLYEIKTAFLSSIPIYATSQQIKECFESQFGPVHEVRLKTNSDGVHYRHGYVEFVDELTLRHCLEHEIVMLDGNPITVAPSIPIKKRNQPHAAPNKKLEKMRNNEKQQSLKVTERTIHVNNIAFGVDEERLRQHFEQIGEVQVATICRSKEGNSKGFGFVKFMYDNDAFSALMLNNSQLDGRNIVVSRSTREITVPNETSEHPSSKKFPVGPKSKFLRDMPLEHRKLQRINLKDEPYKWADRESETSFRASEEVSCNDKSNSTCERTVDEPKEFKSNSEFRALFLRGDI